MLCMGARVTRGKIRAPVVVGAEVRQKGLVDAARDSRQFIDGLLETIDIRRIWLGRRVGAHLGRNVVESRQTVAAVESDDGLDHAAPEEPAAVIVNLEPEVDSGATGVLASHPLSLVYPLLLGSRRF